MGETAAIQDVYDFGGVGEKLELSLNRTHRLALGTVQLGKTYGVANVSGQISLKEASQIIEFSRLSGIDTLDTAISYGEAEERLGELGVTSFRVVTKVPSLPSDLVSSQDVKGWLHKQVKGSIERLRVSKLSALLLHEPNDLLGRFGRELSDGIRLVKSQGLVDNVGLSVYSPAQLAKVYGLISPDIVQLPMNVFDARFASSNWLDRLKLDGVEIHARSIFLQGLLLLPSERIPRFLSPFQSHINKWHDWLDSNATRTSPLNACLSHVASFHQVDRIVVGVDGLPQLKELVHAAIEDPRRAPAWLETNDIGLIDPSLWRLT